MGLPVNGLTVGDIITVNNGPLNASYSGAIYVVFDGASGIVKALDLNRWKITMQWDGFPTDTEHDATDIYRACFLNTTQPLNKPTAIVAGAAVEATSKFFGVTMLTYSPPIYLNPGDIGDVDQLTPWDNCSSRIKTIFDAFEPKPQVVATVHWRAPRFGHCVLLHDAIDLSLNVRHFLRSKSGLVPGGAVARTARPTPILRYGYKADSSDTPSVVLERGRSELRRTLREFPYNKELIVTMNIAEGFWDFFWKDKE